MRTYLSLLIVIALTACAFANEGYYTYTAEVVIATYEAPTAPSGVCDTCGGDGILGDGTIQRPCPDCTTRSMRSNGWPPKRVGFFPITQGDRPIVKIASTAGCRYCEVFAEVDLPKLKKLRFKGRELLLKPLHSRNVRTYPTFVITWRNQSPITLEGYHTASAITSAVQDLMNRPPVPVPDPVPNQ